MVIGRARMKLLLARPRGYCAGVEIAIECLERALALYGPPLYVYHQIVHNRFLVDKYRRRGVTFVEDAADVPVGSTLIYSAHGVAPDVEEVAAQRKLNVIDATCPLVLKVHAEARRFTKGGFLTFLIGHRDHDEVVGVLGEAPGKIHLIESAEDVARFEATGSARAAYLTQTTLGVEETGRIVETLRARFPGLEGPRRSDICYATQNRQEAVRDLAASSDLTLVVGSRNSSNSARLVEVARAQGVPAYLVDDPDEIAPEWLGGVSTLLLTSGASVPEELFEAVVNWFRLRFEASIEERVTRAEAVQFQLPSKLRTSEGVA
jgi:4-hydroxy-3-methylbut-2-enyl diphosphate reductase